MSDAMEIDSSSSSRSTADVEEAIELTHSTNGNGSSAGKVVASSPPPAIKTEAVVANGNGSIAVISNGKASHQSNNNPAAAANTTRRLPSRQARTRALQSLSEPFNFIRNDLTTFPSLSASSSPASSRDKSQSRSKSPPHIPSKSGKAKGKLQDFVEPELAIPRPAYTGLPLEAFPNAKIKKDSLWSLTKRQQMKRKLNGSEPASAAESENEGQSSPAAELHSPSPSTEDEYKRALETSKSESLSKPSRIRGSINGDISVTRTPKRRAASGRGGAGSQQLTVTRTLADDSSHDDHKIKRIKVISPKKPASTNLAPNAVTSVSSPSSRSTSMGATSSSNTRSASSSKGNDTEADDEDDVTKDNDDFCTTCGGSGVFICCDTCPKSFHFSCCEPPLEECPEDNWNCLECLSKTKKPAARKPSIFSKLLLQHESRNPSEFRLPKKIRNHTFIGVHTGDNGAYQDSNMKPELTAKQRQQQSQQIQGYNYDRGLELDSLCDKHGKPYLCHRCGLSGMDGKTITHCDYCPLTWHIDCLDPPLVTPKTIGSKWKCPNHVEDLLMMGLSSKCRQFLNTQVLDVSLQEHFLRVANANNFLIKQSDQLFLKDGREVTLKEYVEFEKDDFNNKENDDGNSTFKAIQRNANNTNNTNTDDDYDENDKGTDVHPNFVVPDFFQKACSTVDGISAKTNPKLDKIIGSNAAGLFTYRVPEESIVLDFISKSKEQAQSTTKRDALDTIGEYVARGRLETNPEDSLLVQTLIQMKNTPPGAVPPRNPATSKIDVDELLHAVSDNVKTESSDVGLDEYEEIAKVKKLMELVGREKMLKFLQSNT